MRAGPLIAAIWLGAMGAAMVEPLKISLLQPPLAFALGPDCQWAPKPWAQILKPPRPYRFNPEARAMMWACYQARGLKSPTPFVNEIRASWPSRAELAQMEVQDAHGLPLYPAEGRPAWLRPSAGE